MKMRIHNRDQLLEWLEDNAPTPSAERAVRSGAVELLGLFYPIPSSPNPGWIVQAVSPLTKQKYNIVVSIIKTKPYHYSWLIEKVPWKSWIGDKHTSPLHLGDNPGSYRMRRIKDG